MSCGINTFFFFFCHGGWWGDWLVGEYQMIHGKARLGIHADPQGRIHSARGPVSILSDLKQMALAAPTIKESSFPVSCVVAAC